LVVNRADLGNADVFRYAEDEGVPILMTIPFDRSIAEAYSRGKLIVEEMPEWRERFCELFNKIDTLVKSQKTETPA
jgi:MinD superfamily P-loop ATPase